MVDSGILVAIVAAIMGAITICLQKCRFLYELHAEGGYELVIGFDRLTSNQSEISQHLHVD